MLNNRRIFLFLLKTAGYFFVFLSLIYNEFILEFFDPSPPLRIETVNSIRYSELIFLSIGLIFIFLSFAARKYEWAERISSQELSGNILLFVLSVIIPLFTLELLLKPFMIVDKVTTIFQKDDILGWKFKPNHTDIWGGFNVSINGKGLRGPELNYKKKKDVIRILYLGDSVTFGYGLENHYDTFPYLTENILEQTQSLKIETINAGVDGYSPWQEYLYLKNEGIKYDPDVIVVGFVLNDITERFQLKRFGGTGQGYQMERTALNILDKITKESSIIFFANKLLTKIKFGSDIQKGAKQKEVLDVKDLVFKPEKEDLKNAWESTLKDLETIFSFSQKNKIPLVLVIFPYTFQFDDAENYSSPQKILYEFAAHRNIQSINLLPLMNSLDDPKNLFFDENHLSKSGSKYVSEVLSNFILNKNLISDIK